jgi:cell division protein FtsW
LKFTGNRENLLAAWWWTVDRYLMTAVFALIAIGFMLVMAASPVVAERMGLGQYHFVRKQVVYILAGLAIMITTSLLSPIATRRLSILAFIGFFFLLIGVDIMGVEANGAKRWLNIAGFTLQPSELLKPFFAIFTAWILTRKNSDNKFPGFTISIISFALIAVLLLRQPNLSMTATVGVIWMTQMFLAGLNMFIILGLGVAGLLTLFGAYYYLPYVQNRINLFMNSSETGGENFQTEKSLEAFHNGGILGTGAGEGVIKQIIPDAHTDFIFAVAGEEFGLLFCLGIISIYGFIIFRCIYRAYNEKDIFILLAITGLAMQLFFQAIVNMGVATNLVPNTGMTLPFVSYGGSSMISVSIVVGLILSLTRKKFG